MRTASTENATSMLNKVPEVTFVFWIIKIMATTVGETGADFLIFKLNIGLTVTTYLMSTLLVLALVIQIRSRKYIPWLYWLAVVMISIVGTLISDTLVDIYAVSLEATTILFSLALIVTFVAWYRSEKTLSIHTIFTFRREAYYWAAILFTFALGTSAGDLASEGWGLGYAVSGFIFAALISIVAISYHIFNVNPVITFWIAYILTRPLGASFGDFLSQPLNRGGMGFGTINTSIVFLLIILGLVAYLTNRMRNKST